MKLLLAIIFSLALGIGYYYWSLGNPGTVMVVYDSKSYEYSLALTALGIACAFLVLYLLLNFLFGIFRAPKKIKEWNAQRQNKRAQTATLSGFARLIEGDWGKGEKELTAKMLHSKTPMLNYLGAAYAAQQQGDLDKRDSYLDKAEKHDNRNAMAIDLTRSRLFMQAGELDRAQELLETMHGKAPANKTVLRLMSDLYGQTHNWDALQGLLPKLNRSKAMDKAQITALDTKCRLECLAENTQGATAKETWKQLPRTQKKEAGLTQAFAAKLIEENEHAEAEVLLRKAIKAEWNPELVALYGKVRTKKLKGQVKFLRAQLNFRTKDPALHMAVARLLQADGQAEQAKLHYQEALANGAADDALYELGLMHEAEGDNEAAFNYYKQGVEAAINLEHKQPTTDAIAFNQEQALMPILASASAAAIEPAQLPAAAGELIASEAKAVSAKGEPIEVEAVDVVKK